jgi:hypothetical protein
VTGGAGVVARPTRNHDTEQSAKFSVIGTSVTTGERLSTSDDR